MSAVQGHWREVSEQTLPAATYLNTSERTSSQLIIIVERKEDWASYFPSEDIVTAQEYLEQTRDNEPGKRVQVINLCRSYKYLGHGYYCSLLAEARGHKVIPSVRTISELTRKSLYGLALDDLDKTLEKALSHHAYSDTEGFTLTLYFGKTNIEPLQDLARQLFEVFACPILLVEFRQTNGWHIEGIKSGALHKLRDDQEDQFAHSLDSFSRKIWRLPRSRRLARYDLAILHDPQEALPPSNAQKERFDAHAISLIDDLIIENNQCYKQAEIYSTVFSGLIDARGNLMNNSMNNLLRKLTLINVVFLPLNLIASVGGMSEFSMMTAGTPWWVSYPLFLTAMMLGAGGMVIGLKRLAK